MRKIIASFLLVFISWLLQGSGYVGDKPDIESFFSQESTGSMELESVEIPGEPLQEEISVPLPPEEVDERSLEADLAPSVINEDNINVVEHINKPQHVIDVLKFMPRIKTFQDTIKTSSSLQVYAAKANIFDFYVRDFLKKYKGKPLEKQPVYELLKDVNSNSQSVLYLWLEARDNSKYLPYSAYNGSYQPSVIRARLKELNGKFDKVLSVINDMDL